MSNYEFVIEFEMEMLCYVEIDTTSPSKAQIKVMLYNILCDFIKYRLKYHAAKEN